MKNTEKVDFNRKIQHLVFDNEFHHLLIINGHITSFNHALPQFLLLCYENYNCFDFLKSV